MGIAGAIIGASVLSAGAQIFGSQSAASAQEKAASAATQAQLAMFGITRASLAPYIGAGNKAIADLFGTAGTNEQWRNAAGATAVRPYGAAAPNLVKAGYKEISKGTPGTPGQLNDLLKPINIDQATLEQTPGYQWTLGQGEKSTENSFAARGLGQSGAAIKGAEQYATGLASQTYQQQFSNALANKQFAYNALTGQEGLGANAAAGVGSAATSTGSSVGGNIIGAGNAAAGADIAGANAATGVSNSLVNALLVQQGLGRSAQSGSLY